MCEILFGSTRIIKIFLEPSSQKGLPDRIDIKDRQKGLPLVGSFSCSGRVVAVTFVLGGVWSGFGLIPQIDLAFQELGFVSGVAFQIKAKHANV